MVDIVTFALENLLNKTSIHADLKKQKTICIRSIFLVKVSGKLWRLLRKWPQKWLVVWLGMGVKKSEKLNEEFSNHKRPHLTKATFRDTKLCHNILTYFAGYLSATAVERMVMQPFYWKVLSSLMTPTSTQLQ